ncbi:MAG TPA: hypothetical protein VML55_08660 [Planctomycetaceae bacterium]|nr:hypothetical protein [Planctomycetaceae bacterium]
MKLLWLLVATCGVSGTDGGAANGRAAEATFRVEEHSPPGTLVGVVPHDGGEARFELIDGDADGVFAVDAASGRIVVANPAALDFEQRPAFTLIVRVTATQADEDPLWKSFAERLGEDELDGLGPPDEVVVEQRVHVRLVDVNEPPAIADQSFHAPGALDGESFLGTVIATDPDAGDRLSFAVVEGDAAGALRIDSTSGRLTISAGHAATLEAGRTRLRVRVTDQGGLSSEATVTITLPQRPAPAALPAPPIAATSDGEPVEAPRPGRTTDPANPATAATRPGVPRLPAPAVPSAQPLPPANGAPTAVDPSTRDDRPSAALASRPAEAVWWRLQDSGSGVSPLLVLFGGLLALTAHFVRVRSLRRRWSAELRNSEDPPVDADDHHALDAARRELHDAQCALAEAAACLAEDRARLTADQRQLDDDREELVARREELTAAEALLIEQRAELGEERRQLDDERCRLEDDRRRLEAEWARLSERPAFPAAPAADGCDDLYAVDADGARLPGNVADASTGSDAETSSADPDLDLLRANLADMFGVPLSDLPARGERPAAKRGPSPSCNSDPEFTPLPSPVAERVGPPGSRDFLDRRMPETVPPDETTPSASGDGSDAISSYMNALLKRMRQNGPGGGVNDAASRPAGPLPAGGPATRPDRAPASVPARPAVASTAAGSDTAAAVGPEPARKEAAAPRLRQNKTHVRDTVNSLREVANLSARSAVASYVRRRRSRRGLLVGVSYVVLLALATALLAGLLSTPVNDTAHPWFVLGMGVVVIVHYFYTICLADRQPRLRGQRAVAKPWREQPDGEGVPAQPAGRSRSGQRSAASGEQPRQPASSGRERPDAEPARDEGCAVAAR